MLPIIKAADIISHSNGELFIILMPNTGNELTSKGRTAQCTAQAIEVSIPKKSQFISVFIKLLNAKIVNLQH